MTDLRNFLLLPISGLVFQALLVAQQIAPAGTLVQCTISEKISSQNTNVGDPVVCDVSRSAIFPYGTKLTGQFEDYKDPGHLVGKGWMALSFDRALLGTYGENKVMPVSAKVVNVPGYRTDKEGRILGKGHAVRDTLAWLVPVLWPIDLVELPRRGPRPTLKPETRVTVKLMEDLQIAEPRKMAAAEQLTPRPMPAYQAPASYSPAPVLAPAAPAPVYLFVSAPPPPPTYMVAPPPPAVTMWAPAVPMSRPYVYSPAPRWSAPQAYAPQPMYSPSSSVRPVLPVRTAANPQYVPISNTRAIDGEWHPIGGQ